MIYIYTLRCENNKYYIGRTTNPEFRIESHFTSNGSGWTNKYKPIEVIELIGNCEKFDEDKYTLKYMAKYGVNNVRGGSFCEMELTPANLSTIQRMINGSTDKCYVCGSSEHFANDCTQVKEENNSNNNNIFSIIGNAINNYLFGNNNNEIVYACDYCGKEFETMKGTRYHENIYCKEKKKNTNTVTNITKKTNTNKISNKVVCYKCGKEGHYANNCYSNKKYTSKSTNNYDCCSDCYDCSSDDGYYKKKQYFKKYN